MKSAGCFASVGLNKAEFRNTCTVHQTPILTDFGYFKLPQIAWVLFLIRLLPNHWSFIPKRKVPFTFIGKDNLGLLANSLVSFLLCPAETLPKPH